LTVPEKKKRSSSGRRMLPKLHNCQRTGDRSMLTSERFKVIPFHSILTIFYLFSDAFLIKHSIEQQICFEDTRAN